MLTCHLIATVLLQRILRFFAGPVWWTYLVALVYGCSLIFMSALDWFSAGLQTLPPAAFALAAIHAHLCWRRTGRLAWLIWSVAAVGGTLLFYEKGVLVPVYLLLMSVLLLEPERPLGDRIRSLLSEWRVWALYAGLLAVYLIVYSTRPHQVSWHLQPFGETMEFVRIAWLDGAIPALLGVRVTATSDTLVNTWAVAGCQLLVIGAVVYTVWRRRSAWKAWAFLVAVFLLNQGLVLPRVSQLGTGAGYLLKYHIEFASLALIAVGCAFVGTPVRDPEAMSLGRPRLPVAAALAAALAVFLALTVTADGDILRAWNGQESRAWFERVRGDIRAIQRTDPHPVILDEPVPKEVLQFWIKLGGNVPSQTLTLSLSGLRFNEAAPRTYRIDPFGHVRRVTFEPAVGGRAPRLLRDHQLVVTGTRPRDIGSEVCVPASTRWSHLEMRPRRALVGEQWYLRSEYRTSGRGGLYVLVDRGIPYPPRPDRGLPPRPHGGSALTEMGALFTGPPTFRGLRIEVPPGAGACFRRLVVGAFRPA